MLITLFLSLSLAKAEETKPAKADPVMAAPAKDETIKERYHLTLPYGVKVEILAPKDSGSLTVNVSKEKKDKDGAKKDQIVRMDIVGDGDTITRRNQAVRDLMFDLRILERSAKDFINKKQTEFDWTPDSFLMTVEFAAKKSVGGLRTNSPKKTEAAEAKKEKTEKPENSKQKVAKKPEKEVKKEPKIFEPKIPEKIYKNRASNCTSEKKIQCSDGFMGTLYHNHMSAYLNLSCGNLIAFPYFENFEAVRASQLTLLNAKRRSFRRNRKRETTDSIRALMKECNNCFDIDKRKIGTELDALVDQVDADIRGLKNLIDSGADEIIIQDPTMAYQLVSAMQCKYSLEEARYLYSSLDCGQTIGYKMADTCTLKIFHSEKEYMDYLRQSSNQFESYNQSGGMVGGGGMGTGSEPEGAK